MNEQHTVSEHSPVNDEIDLRQILGMAWQYRIWIFAILFLSVSVALIKISTSVPTYRSDALLRIEEKNNPLSLLQELPFSNDIVNDKKSEKEIITSRRIIGATVDDLRLQLRVSPIQKGFFEKIFSGKNSNEEVVWVAGGVKLNDEIIQLNFLEVPSGIVANQYLIRTLADDKFELYSAENQLVLVGQAGKVEEKTGYRILVEKLRAKPGTTFEVSLLPRHEAIDALQKRLNIAAGGKTAQDIIRISVEDQSAELAAALVNTVIKHYVQYNIKSHTAVTEKTLAFVEGQLAKFSGDLSFNNNLYMMLLTKAHQLRVMKAGVLGNIQVIDPAIIPYEPIPNKNRLIFLGSIMLGGLLGLLAALLRGVLDSKLYDPSVVEENLNLPIYATIPFSQKQKGLGKHGWWQGSSPEQPFLLYNEAADDPAIEAMRFLRTLIHGGELHLNPHSTIGITGPSPNVGKTFLSANLACLLAEIGLHVLVIDADIRKGTLHKYYTVDNECGLAEYLAGLVEDDAIIKNSQFHNLDVITRGGLHSNTSVLMNSSRLEKLLSSCRKQYDIVLLDTPPALAVTDGVIVSRYCDRLMIVIRSGVTTLDEVSACWRRLTQSGKKPSGLVMSGYEPNKLGYGKYRQYSY